MTNREPEFAIFPRKRAFRQRNYLTTTTAEAT